MHSSNTMCINGTKSGQTNIYIYIYIYTYIYRYGGTETILGPAHVLTRVGWKKALANDEDSRLRRESDCSSERNRGH